MDAPVFQRSRNLVVRGSIPTVCAYKKKQKWKYYFSKCTTNCLEETEAFRACYPSWVRFWLLLVCTSWEELAKGENKTTGEGFHYLLQMGHTNGQCSIFAVKSTGIVGILLGGLRGRQSYSSSSSTLLSAMSAGSNKCEITVINHLIGETLKSTATPHLLLQYLLHLQDWFEAPPSPY